MTVQSIAAKRNAPWIVDGALRSANTPYLTCIIYFLECPIITLFNHSGKRIIRAKCRKSDLVRNLAIAY